jgi:ABC-2 type transport system permease protein
MVLSFVFFTYISARVYRIGVLMYGKKVTLKEIARWAFKK